MAIRTVVTRGFGNGTYNGTIALIVLRGYLAGPSVVAFVAAGPEHTVVLGLENLTALIAAESLTQVLLPEAVTALIAAEALTLPLEPEAVTAIIRSLKQ